MCKNIRIMLLVFSFGLFLFLGCIKPKVHLDAGNVSTTEVNELLKHHNSFTLNFMKLLENDTNAFFSPFSVYVVLGMLREGAGGKTLVEMDNALGLNNKSKYVFAYLINNLSKKDLILANAMWIDKRVNVSSAYKTILSRHFGSVLYDMDVAYPDKVVDEVNDWASKNTNGRINKILNQNDVDKMTRFILANAVYFKEEWKQQFRHIDTYPFFVDENETVDVEMMHDEIKNVSYYEDDDWQVIALPYKDGDLRMVVFLPKNRSYLPELNETTFARVLSNMENRKMDVYLPKIELFCSYNLIPLMKKMGINTLFDPNEANLTGISDDPLYISVMRQKSFVKVDEKGTEAAAVTVAVGRLALAPSSIFMANHPFLFFIVDRESGLILFAGRVMNPVEQC